MFRLLNAFHADEHIVDPNYTGGSKARVAGAHGERETGTNNVGLRAKPPAVSMGSGAKPPDAEPLLGLSQPEESVNLS